MIELPRCLSVRQPYADAIIHGGKDVENRDRRTTYRGQLLIHSSAGMTGSEADAFNWFMEDRGIPTKWQNALNPFVRRGYIVGVADLVDCVDQSDSPWFVGRFGYVLTNPRSLPLIPCKGTISPLFWTVPPAVADRVREALAAITTKSNYDAPSAGLDGSAVAA
jgi:hypothetical protein